MLLVKLVDSAGFFPCGSAQAEKVDQPDLFSGTFITLKT
jgi:hypothetical protein